jgi:IS5 family transposase
VSTVHDKIPKEIEEQIFNSAISPDHAYRKINRLIDFESLSLPLSKLYSPLGQKGVPASSGIKAMLLQFWEDLSDREMERAVCENLAMRWFCGFSLNDKTPDHSYFGKFRKRMGTKRLAELFNGVNDQLRKEGLFGNIFYFLDASTIVSKSALWEERDKAIKDGHDKLNNLIIKDYAPDKDARWGAKSKKNIWYGYKRHTSVDMRYGLITKTAVTPANVPDFKVVKRIIPEAGLIFMDKLYDTKTTDTVIRGSGCSPGTIRKNNNPNKNFDLDRWRSQVRMPFEGTFASLTKRARYKTLERVSFQVFAQSLVFNLKKAIKFTPNLAYV